MQDRPVASPFPQSSPADAGFDPAALHAAVDYAMKYETPWPRDLRQHIGSGHFEPPPYNEPIGPIRERGGPAGVILRHGKEVAAWGDPERRDQTFSIAKSYLSTCVGLAWDRGMIPDLDAPVRDLVDDGGFEPPHNAKITWRMLLQQTSEWEGTLWDKPDWLDRNRDLSTEGADKFKKPPRTLEEPGTYWEYNDVRVNRLALAAMRVWRRPLPEVLDEYVMGPMGSSGTWEWRGYRNSTVEIDGRAMESVSGGSHWGGGMFIGSRDHALLGQLMLNRGQKNGQRLISEEWLEQAFAPCRLNPAYGFMWWLNTNQASYPSAPASSVFAMGAGSNVIWIDREHDLVAVVRWIEKPRIDGFVNAVLQAVR